MNTLEKINRAKQEVAEEILEKMSELFENGDRHDPEEILTDIQDYINKEHLHKSDYTK